MGLHKNFVPLSIAVLLLTFPLGWATHYLFWQPVSLSFTLTVALLRLNPNLQHSCQELDIKRLLRITGQVWKGYLGQPWHQLRLARRLNAQRHSGERTLASAATGRGPSLPPSLPPPFLHSLEDEHCCLPPAELPNLS